MAYSEQVEMCITATIKKTYYFEAPLLQYLSKVINFLPYLLYLVS